MDPLLALAALAAAILLGAWWWMRGRAAPPDLSDGSVARDKRVEGIDTVAGWPPEPTRVLTHAERKAHALLVRSVPECLVLAQVPLARFIRVPTRNSYHEWMRRVGQLCADLVVCDEGAQVIAVVEVRRDLTKLSERSRKRHERMDRVLHQAGVRVLVWTEGSLPGAEVVRDLVLSTPKSPLHSEEGAASVRTLDADRTPPNLRTVPLPVQPQAATSRATLEEVLDEIDQQQRAQGDALPEPPSSTWMDDFDSRPAPLGGAAAPRLR
ncbi:MAG TPA: DUF2726 domain-containing protein [Methylibium sp.]|uniref:DUF2726 domain-containing protein n=1 Tax=Methylibium sp. TaxID=2067992 RepID=UPI002DBAA9DF|nr:DUF2726 domain-containing protein [Methylibium sp.]HEU4457919.1 DUF2726 domain-containing protein [Methylibium sp.]